MFKIQMNHTKIFDFPFFFQALQVLWLFQYCTSNILIKDTQGKSTVKWNSSAYKKYEYGHLGRWYIKSTLYQRFLNWNKIFKKSIVVTGKIPFFVIGPFCTQCSICLNVAFWYGSLHENDAFSILVLSTKKTVLQFF